MLLERAPFNLEQLTTRLRLSLGAEAENKGLRLSVDCDPAIEDWVCGDPHSLGQVLRNLAGNAIQFTERGEIAVAIEMLLSPPNSYLLRFSIKDSGIGIPSHLHSKVFEPFFQVALAGACASRGTGLGASIASELVELMGGELKLESELGGGSLFYFDLRLPRVSKPEQRPLDMAGWQEQAPALLDAVPGTELDPRALQALEGLSRRPQFLREFLLSAAQDLRKNCDELIRAREDLDLLRMREAAHALKGVAANVGADRLRSLATQLLNCSRTEGKALGECPWREPIEASLATASLLLSLVAGIDLGPANRHKK